MKGYEMELDKNLLERFRQAHKLRRTGMKSRNKILLISAAKIFIELECPINARKCIEYTETELKYQP